MHPLRVRLLTSAAGNVFMAEIAALLGAALTDLGVAVEYGTSLDDPGPATVPVVVAPHEFFVLAGVGYQRALDFASRCVVVTTEQPGTPWYDIGRRFARVAAGVLDVNVLGVSALHFDGIKAVPLRLGYHESLDRWHGLDPGGRARDALFMGSLSPRRSEALAQMAPVLAKCSARLLVHDGAKPVAADDPYFVRGDARSELLADTKVLLNIHRADKPYAEWHRFLPALANGCVLLSEPIAGSEPLEGGVHYAVAPVESFGDYLTMLVSAEDIRSRMAMAAYDVVRSELHQTRLLEPVLPLLDAAAGARARRRVRLPRRVPAGFAGTASGTVEPVPVQNPPAEARVLKRVVLAQHQLRRQVEAIECRARFGSDQHAAEVTTPGFEAARPDVSVILPVYNYEFFVGAALESALASRGVRVEVIVVDDHSTDGSRAAVEAVMARRPHTAVKLVSLAVNCGLSAVRNLALPQARSDFVFMLDADNEVFPDAIARLRALLGESDAAFAYGMIATHGTRWGLLSEFPWDVDRLVRGNYIDAMALLRRRVLEDFGGYSVEMQNRHGGWEDFELWLHLASKGERGAFLPELIGRYRAHGTSMVSTVGLDVDSATDYLRERYPDLPWPPRKDVGIPL